MWQTADRDTADRRIEKRPHQRCIIAKKRNKSKGSQKKRLPRGQRVAALRKRFLAFCEAEQLDFGESAGAVFDSVFEMQDMMFLGEQEPDELDSMTLFELIAETIPARTIRDDLSDIPAVGRELGRFMASRYPARWPDLDEFLTDIDVFIQAGTVNTVPKSGQTRMLQHAIDAGFDLSSEAGMNEFMMHFNSLTIEQRSAILGDDEPTSPPLVTGTYDGEAWGSGQRRADFLADGAPEDFLPGAFDAAELDEETQQRLDRELLSAQHALRDVFDLPDQITDPVELPEGSDDPRGLLELPLAAGVLRLLAWVDAGEKNRRTVTSTQAIRPADLVTAGQLCPLDRPDRCADAKRMDEAPLLAVVWRLMQGSDFIVSDTKTTMRCGPAVQASGLVDFAHAFDEQLRSGASPAEAAAAVPEPADEGALGLLQSFMGFWAVYALFLERRTRGADMLEPVCDQLCVELSIVFANGLELLIPRMLEIGREDPRIGLVGAHLKAADALLPGGPAEASADSDWAITALIAVDTVIAGIERLQRAGFLTEGSDGRLHAEGIARILFIQLIDLAAETGLIERPGGPT